MNKVILMGRLTRDPEVRYSQGGENSLAIARYTLAVDRRFKLMVMIRLLTSSVALRLDETLSSLRSISVRD